MLAEFLQNTSWIGETVKVNYAIEVACFSDVAVFFRCTFSRFIFDYAIVKEIISTLPKLEEKKNRENMLGFFA